MFEISTIPFSDSDSDCEVPEFDISAFKKYASAVSEETSSDNFHNKSIKLSSSLSADSEYNKTSYVTLNPEKRSFHDQVQQQKKYMQKTLNEDESNSIVLQPGFGKLDRVPGLLSKRQCTKRNAKQRDKSKGFDWFNMPAPEMTEEKKNDLMVVQMRQALDPKHFYKRSALKGNPKFFQVGTFVESPVEFYSSRIPKKQRKQTLVDELLADAQFRKYQKKKYSEIVQSQPRKFVKRKKVKNNKVSQIRENSTKHKKTKK